MFRNENFKIKNNRGISLVSMLIMVIVIIIIASIAINGGSGLINICSKLCRK